MWIAIYQKLHMCTKQDYQELDILTSGDILFLHKYSCWFYAVKCITAHVWKSHRNYLFSYLTVYSIFWNVYSNFCAKVFQPTFYIVIGYFTEMYTTKYKKTLLLLYVNECCTNWFFCNFNYATNEVQIMYNIN